MILTPEQIESARDAINLSPLEDDHPVMEQLKEAFGSHTFFLHQEGLSIFVDPAKLEMPAGDLRMVTIAQWTDETKGQLGAVEPFDTGITLPSGSSPGVA